MRTRKVLTCCKRITEQTEQLVDTSTRQHPPCERVDVRELVYQPVVTGSQLRKKITRNRLILVHWKMVVKWLYAHSNWSHKNSLTRNSDHNTQSHSNVVCSPITKHTHLPKLTSFSQSCSDFLMKGCPCQTQQSTLSLQLTYTSTHPILFQLSRFWYSVTGKPLIVKIIPRSKLTSPLKRVPLIFTITLASVDWF